MGSAVIPLVIAIIVIGVFVYVAIAITSNKRHAFNVEEYQASWLAINNGIEKDSRDSANMAIVKADKLLDKALIELGIPGKTMGERMKKIGSRFSQENAVWAAHKIRNRIAHENDFSISYDNAKKALVVYKQALKDIGAI